MGWTGPNKSTLENSLVVRWLRLGTCTAEGLGSIPSQETKIPQAVRRGKKKTQQLSALTHDLAVSKSSPNTERPNGGGGTPPALMDTNLTGFDHCTGMVRESSQPDLVTQGEAGPQGWQWPSLPSGKHCQVL